MGFVVMGADGDPEPRMIMSGSLDGGFDGSAFRCRERRMLNRHNCNEVVENVRSWAAFPWRSLVLSTVFVTSFVTLVGCGNILGIEDIDPCFDASGFDGRGCYRTSGGCKLTKEQLPNACTDAPCVPFDNQERLGLSSPDDLPDVEPMTTVGPGMPPAAGMGECPDINRVVVVGSNAIVPILEHVSALLATADPPMTVLYQRQSSCDGARAIVEDTMVAGEFTYWTFKDGLPSSSSCALPAQLADIGTSDVFASTCGLDANSAIAVDAQGPIQAMIFLTPKTSPERAISAEAARLVYGYGGSLQNFTSPPWMDTNFIQRRDAPSGTQTMIGEFIGVPSAEWKGQINTSTSSMVASLLAPTTPTEAASTIGILDVVNGARSDVLGTLRVLAFQAEGQNCGFYPDSVDGNGDKRNVRDGHYALWGPIHVYRRKGAMNFEPTVANALSLQQAPSTPGSDDEQTMRKLIEITSTGNLVPSCAMTVQRTIDGEDLLPLVPNRSCACFFDLITTDKTNCQVCTSDLDCTSPDAQRCNYGFCEKQ